MFVKLPWENIIYIHTLLEQMTMCKIAEGDWNKSAVCVLRSLNVLEAPLECDPDTDWMAIIIWANDAAFSSADIGILQLETFFVQQRVSQKYAVTANIRHPKWQSQNISLSVTTVFNIAIDTVHCHMLVQ